MDELEVENRRLRRRVTELEAEKADVEAFAAVAAHELLVPLVLADAYATTVAGRLDEELHADARRDLEALRRAASRTRLLVETLLHDARSHDRPLQLRAVTTSTSCCASASPCWCPRSGSGAPLCRSASWPMCAATSR